ncbi:UDP-N-acetylmuramoylalanine--D-glutamate ligase [Desulfohalotomaculum tongense]|uniref:UDP-N-acetylmuramoyl-L-alanine--D-glutamate ligase n=1 Tax=Desulforadius tongensis TaxID=1216062 RepID=UPI00195B39FD|nr:UDP-N-acetylmuramoyl-L-alanine--D-glutamate ligase [Desulforadius tongensis]MBM7855937.1 UDP-N-acetylmuramoylalanine--D-glutamate ligase [Desulforadius tongensis]
MHLDDKKILVVGAARSGIAAAEFLVGKGAEVTLTDAKPAEELGEKVQKLAGQGVNLALGGQYPDPAAGGYHMVVVSPGVPLTFPPVAQAHRADIPVIGELELAFRFAEAPVVAVTGTNGKTTTTSLVGEIFKNSGINTLVAGNIGLPLISAVENYGEDDVIVVEVSSFQLETIQTFRPHVAVILNITPDHLDRHGSMDNYIAAKAKIFSNQVPLDYTVLNYDQPNTAALAQQSMGRVIFFSRQHTLDTGVYIQKGNIVVTMDGVTTEILPVNKLSMPGGHNLENALAAVACAAAMGVKVEQIQQTLSTFPGVAHRLETVAEINGVRYVNDSKATNPDAAVKALEAFNQPIVLIAGGLNKGSSFTELARKIKEKVRVLILLGEHGDEIKRAVQEQNFDTFVEVEDYLEAVKVAHRVAEPGEVVLLSPACASWDMFRNYEQRGNLFRELVLKLRG